MQLLSDFVEDVVLVLAFESEARTASRHTQAFHFRQNVDQLFSHPVAQVFVALVRAHVHERQHRDRFLVGGGRGAWSDVGGRNTGRCRTLLA